jgi:6-pyruvoyltetrahydropterin/6-carboxytetrahydropterin synthase
MFRVTREIEFCYGHRLLNYNGKCRHLHGHNGRAVITLAGQELDSRGMLVDFVDIKKTVQQWIDDNLDHNMLLCRDDPILPVSSTTTPSAPVCPSSKSSSGKPSIASRPT